MENNIIQCKKCHRLKSLELMAKDKRRKNGITNVCNECENIRTKKYYHSFVAKRKVKGRHAEYLSGLIRYSYGNAKSRAVKKNIEFNITIEYLKQIYTDKCAITGIEFRVNNRLSTYSPSLDRINNSKGYIIGNVRYILYGINALKSDTEDKDVYKICLLVVANKKKLWLHPQQQNDLLIL